MKNPDIKKVLTVLSMAGLTGLLVGCGGEEPVAARPSPRNSSAAPNSAPKTTRLVSVDKLMQEMGIDSRLDLPEDKAPGSTEQRRAVLSFFDAIVRSDDSSMNAMITPADQYELGLLVTTGEWEDATSGIHDVMIETGKSPLGLDCALAIFEIGDSYQPQMWYYSRSGGEMVFESVSSPPNIINRLYGSDHIKVWHDILAEEEELATKPDDEVNIETVVLDDQGSSSSNGLGPSGQPGRKNPNGPKRRPPGVDPAFEPTAPGK